MGHCQDGFNFIAQNTSPNIEKCLVNIFVLMKTVKFMLLHIWHHFKTSLLHFVNLLLNSFQHITTQREKLGETAVLKSEPDGSSKWQSSLY